MESINESPALVKPTYSAPTAEYIYTDADGHPCYKVLRFGTGAGKTFTQMACDGGRWTYGLGTHRDHPLPYRLPEVLKGIARGEVIWLVEGEKDAGNGARAGLNTTCNNGGAGHWKQAQSTHLAGASVAILPDNDLAGARHAETAALYLAEAGCNVRVVPVPASVGGRAVKDLSDYLEAGGTPAGLRALYQAAPAYIPPPPAPIAPTPARAPVPVNSDRLKVWAGAALEGEYSTLAAATDGRFGLLKAAATRLGTIAAHGLLAEADCLNTLYQVVQVNGYAGKVTQKTAEYQARFYFTKGLAHPCDLPQERIAYEKPIQRIDPSTGQATQDQAQAAHRVGLPQASPAEADTATESRPAQAIPAWVDIDPYLNAALLTMYGAKQVAIYHLFLAGGDMTRADANALAGKPIPHATFDRAVSDRLIQPVLSSQLELTSNLHRWGNTADYVCKFEDQSSLGDTPPTEKARHGGKRDGAGRVATVYQAADPDELKMRLVRALPSYLHSTTFPAPTPRRVLPYPAEWLDAGDAGTLEYRTYIDECPLDKPATESRALCDKRLKWLIDGLESDSEDVRIAFTAGLGAAERTIQARHRQGDKSLSYQDIAFWAGTAPRSAPKVLKRAGARQTGTETIRTVAASRAEVRSVVARCGGHVTFAHFIPVDGKHGAAAEHPNIPALDALFARANREDRQVEVIIQPRAVQVYQTLPDGSYAVPTDTPADAPTTQGDATTRPDKPPTTPKPKPAALMPHDPIRWDADATPIMHDEQVQAAHLIYAYYRIHLVLPDAGSIGTLADARAWLKPAASPDLF